MADTGTDRPITRDDLRAGFAGIQAEVDDQAETVRTTALVVGAVVVAVVVVVAFGLGRRKGKQDKTVVEIRRV
jgi:hypothetical protein